MLAQYEQANFEKYKKEFIALREQVDKEIGSRQIELLRKAQEGLNSKKAGEEKPKDFRE